MLKRFKLFITAMFTLMLFSARAQITLNSSIGQVQSTINQHNTTLNNLKVSIYDQVVYATTDVTKLSNGSMSYPNWVRFVQIAEFIDSLNTVWNDAYGDALNQVINQAITDGATNATSQDEQSKDHLSDIIEDQYLSFESDIASVSFESRFDFTSLRKCLEAQEDSWLDEQSPNSIDFSESPILSEEFDDDEYWTLITCSRQYHIVDNNVTESMMGGLGTEAQRSIIDILKDIVPILQGIVQVGEELNKLFADCAGATTSTQANKKDGFKATTLANKWIGYKMVQKGVLIDFANTTTTKIKGKAYVRKEKSNGKLKKDKRTRVGVSYCAIEWDNCQNKDWPSDYPNPYKGPRAEHRKKAKVKDKHPKALSIEKSYHYLQFRFGLEGIFEKALNLFGSNGCVRASNTDW